MTQPEILQSSEHLEPSDPSDAEGSPETSAPRRPRRALTLALTTVLALAALGSGIGYTVVKVDDADRTAPTKAWKKPKDAKPGKDASRWTAEGRTDTALAKRLLPVPGQYELGPDIDEYGNDVVLSGREAEAVLKETGRGLSATERRSHRKAIDRLRIEGIGMRSYQGEYGDTFVAEITLAQMKNGKALRELTEFQGELADAFRGYLRKGPKIEGHKNAQCFLPPKDSKNKLDQMFCTAHVDNVLVSFTAYGAKPFDTEEAAVLLRDQLDHIDAPGEYV
ncbi:hypothetical protein [Streptomyces sp. NBC_01304]|uniref:hypothetical protein n=1 Tax=Streptomyces sp. NBC_01304 TaxID=2903818 RepID=UPI002E0F4E7F|nr:hypothetical protein OG430_26880 [Streptomyces sp. NBC_01304]